ncbi:hypothetical protein VOLCADRAFT_92520 [Volvox carteri f. nagariensis]|uniref:Pherophorin domain-containing protein n=1 Tax=Volvox carteri f. nagariensis TaxID=3068 RepID=D8TZV9_VOLCA|nr:uncharacterized protein VOLCADRAFT_92520 [Volvox carteri f. nagariensis]EFJ46992.1 hypothetical protein VOLCADRAFT_92520 [Volvox carteri f. nagariensis]|eukprot:XP_002951887.1 hypothetical protein VOLCADRAFT_92520 [Volvox carteri f. nagariensis]
MYLQASYTPCKTAGCFRGCREAVMNSCLPFQGYVWTLNYDHYGDDIGQASSLEAAAAACSALPDCLGFNILGYFKSQHHPMTLSSRPYFCFYTKITSVYVTNYLCGTDNIFYKTASDVSMALIYPLQAISGHVGSIFDFAKSSFGCGLSDGPLHGGYSARPTFTLDFRQQLSNYSMRITRVSACCAGQYAYNNGVQGIRMRTAGGVEVYSGGECTNPQPWVNIPTGYVLSGLRTNSPADGSRQWVHRVAFVANHHVHLYIYMCVVVTVGSRLPKSRAIGPAGRALQ